MGRGGKTGNKSAGAIGLFALVSPCTLTLVLSLAGPCGLTAYPLFDSPSWQKAALLP